MKISDNRNNCKVVVSYVETQSEINMKFNHSWASLVAQHKESAYNEGDLGLIPGLGRSPGGEHGKPLQYSCLENLHGQRSLAGYSP